MDSGWVVASGLVSLEAGQDLLLGYIENRPNKQDVFGESEIGWARVCFEFVELDTLFVFRTFRTTSAMMCCSHALNSSVLRGSPV